MYLCREVTGDLELRGSRREVGCCERMADAVFGKSTPLLKVYRKLSLSAEFYGLVARQC